MSIWVSIVNTESGDRGIDGYWTKKPSKEFMEKFYKENWPDEFECWCDDDEECDCEPTLHWRLVKLEPNGDTSETL